MASDGTGLEIVRRSHHFALAVRSCVKRRRWSRVQHSDLPCLLRSSGAVAAHYLEAGHAFSRMDCARGMILAREQAAASMLWLQVLAETSPDQRPLALIERLHDQADNLHQRLRSILRDIS